MQDKLKEMLQRKAVLKRESKRFKEYGCVRRTLTYKNAKKFPLTECVKWWQIEKRFASISPVVQMLSQCDLYTLQHSVRVALITYRICMLIKMSNDCRRTITLSAYTHDIGKISIPNGILNKEGPLTDEEYEKIKHHPKDGADLLGQQQKYKNIKDGVMYHHERWDGNGYTTGAKGEEIPFAARIIAVGDSIDAMMSDRPYRKALTNEQCYAEIEKNSNRMYEPQIVNMVLENWNYIIDGIY